MLGSLKHHRPRLIEARHIADRLEALEDVMKITQRATGAGPDAQVTHDLS